MHFSQNRARDVDVEHFCLPCSIPTLPLQEYHQPPPPAMLFSPRSVLSSFSRLSLSSTSHTTTSSSPLFTPRLLTQVRHKSLVPRRTKYRKSHKGRIPIALGGSTKGTTLEWGDYGLRVCEPVRLSAKHLETAEAALKRGLKPVRGSKV